MGRPKARREEGEEIALFLTSVPDPLRRSA